MQSTISKQTRKEVLEAVRERYQQARKQDKTKILDEFIAVAGCHRKHAIRLLADFRTGASEVPALIGGPTMRRYAKPLSCSGKRPTASAESVSRRSYPNSSTAMERHGHLALDPAVRHRVLAVSPATIDRLLATVRGHAAGRKKRRNQPSRASRSPFVLLRTGMSHCLVFSRSTSFPTAAVQCKGYSCGASWRPTSARVGRRPWPWWLGNSPWSRKGSA